MNIIYGIEIPRQVLIALNTVVWEGILEYVHQEYNLIVHVEDFKDKYVIGINAITYYDKCNKIDTKILNDFPGQENVKLCFEKLIGLILETWIHVIKTETERLLELKETEENIETQMKPLDLPEGIAMNWYICGL